MRADSPILRALAELYESSAAGRHGGGKLDVQPLLEDLLAAASCAEGEARELAERDLRAAAAAGLLTLEPTHRRDPESIGRVRLAPEREAEFFQRLGRKSPAALRAEWAELFSEATASPMPERFAPSWR